MDYFMFERDKRKELEGENGGSDKNGIK